jgi:hypothetical protein
MDNELVKMALARHHIFDNRYDCLSEVKLTGVSRLCVDISTTLRCQLQACISTIKVCCPASAEAKTRWAAFTGFDVS